jgi:tartrate-resistant acid phosphatase type 5
MGSSRTVVMVCGLSLAWTLSCSQSQTDNGTDPSPAVDAGGSKPDAKAGPPKPPGSGGVGGTGGTGMKGAGAQPGAPKDASTPPKDAGTAPQPTGDASVVTGTGGSPPGAAGAAGASAGTTGTGGAPPVVTGTGGAPPVVTGTGGAPPVVTGTGGSAARPVVTRRIAVFGDYGGDTADEAAVAALVAKWNPDAVFTTGDNNYVDGKFEGYDEVVGKHYHSFMGAYRGKYGAGAATNRFWPGLGDHDWELGIGGYTDYFALPGNERYYDVDLGPVHLYAINSNAEEPDGYQPTSVQGTWLKNKLAASTSCFDLVTFHHPPYSSGEHGSRPHMLWPFAAWGAEATFAGHDHDYERLEVSGIPYFVTGTGGLGLRKFPGAPLPETKFRNDTAHGAMLITASSNGTITYEFWSTAGAKLDSLTVTKTCSSP